MPFASRLELPRRPASQRIPGFEDRYQHDQQVIRYASEMLWRTRAQRTATSRTAADFGNQTEASTRPVKYHLANSHAASGRMLTVRRFPLCPATGADNLAHE
jgi:hypothetical protein